MSMKPKAFLVLLCKMEPSRSIFILSSLSARTWALDSYKAESISFTTCASAFAPSLATCPTPQAPTIRSFTVASVGRVAHGPGDLWESWEAPSARRHPSRRERAGALHALETEPFLDLRRSQERADGLVNMVLVSICFGGLGDWTRPQVVRCFLPLTSSGMLSKQRAEHGHVAFGDEPSPSQLW